MVPPGGHGGCGRDPGVPAQVNTCTRTRTRARALSLTRALTLAPTLIRSTRAVRVLGPLALFAGSVCCFALTPNILPLTRSLPDLQA